MESSMIGKANVIFDATCWYQPIYELCNKNIIGHEALMRSKTIDNINPLNVFKKAEILGKQAKLDRHMILKAQQIYKDSKNNGFLFINIFPSTILEKDFLSWWDENAKIVNSVVLEISEEESIYDLKSIKHVINKLKERNVKIAIDDMGTAYASIQSSIELEPDYIKIDEYFMLDLASSKIKQNIVRSVVEIYDTCKVIIEGVEDLNDIGLLKDLGVNYAQGYALGKPSPINKINSIR